MTAEDSGTAAPMTAERQEQARRFADEAPGRIAETFIHELLAEVDRLRAEAAHCPQCDHPTGEHFGAWCRTHIGHNRICGCSTVTSVSTPAYGRVEFANHPASEHTP